MTPSAVGTHPVARYIPLLIAGDEQGLRGLFTGAPRVNDPRLGWVDQARFGEFVSNSHHGLAERSASVEHVATIMTARGAVEECLLSLVRSGAAVSLPVAVASDTSSGSRLESVRIYHSMRPLVGVALSRGPVLPVVAALLLPDVVGRYHDCLARADVTGILEQFAPGAELREAAGPTTLHRGVEALRRFFTVLFAGGGGVAVEQCALADDGTSCALEYLITGRGGAAARPKASASVFERAGTGLLAAVRLYDDIERRPPQA